MFDNIIITLPQSKQWKLILAALLSFAFCLFISSTSHAAFNAGNIISNAKFTDYNSMNAAQIQQFLNSKNSVCLKDTNKKYQSLVDDNGDGVVADSTTEKYGRHASMTAAQLINAAAKIYKINPQVILVTLQKEQGLITRTDCPQWRYNTALGYGCPDTAPCDNSAFGFTRQIDYGTYHFRGYFNDSLTYVPFGTGNHRIYYNPDSSCGSSIVNIQNRATASLYSYTPYQPNAAALAAGYGEAPCGAYGNRNFYLFFTSWFGSTQGNRWSNMLQKRIMSIDTSSISGGPTYKINPDTNEVYYDNPLVDGQPIYFYSKTSLNDGSECLRTKIDTANNINKCVKIIRLKEFTPVYQDIAENEKSVLASRFTNKVDFIHDRIEEDYTIQAGQPITLSKKITILGQTYYITQQDYENNKAYRGIKAERIKTLDNLFENFMQPRYMHANKQTPIINLSTGAVAYSAATNTHFYFNKKVTLGDKEYYTSDYLRGQGQYYAVSSRDISDGANFQPFINPRDMTLSQNAYKLSLDSNANVDDLLLKDKVIHFSQKLTINNKEYYRTTFDKTNRHNRVIDSTKVSD